MGKQDPQEEVDADRAKDLLPAYPGRVVDVREYNPGERTGKNQPEPIVQDIEPAWCILGGENNVDNKCGEPGWQKNCLMGKSSGNGKSRAGKAEDKEKAENVSVQWIPQGDNQAQRDQQDSEE